MTIGNQVFKNFENESFGSISLERALEVSCDTVFYGISYNEWKKDGGTSPKNPNDWFYKTAHQFGLGAKTGIDLPGEVTGRVPDRQWKQSYYDANKDYWCKVKAANKNNPNPTWRPPSRSRTAPTATCCAPVTRSTTRSARATPWSPRSRWPRSTRRSATAAPSTSRP